ncbi:MAG TPA: class I SAM-dependent methyltransferase [Candidatus Margulisiibacteriota bacterium]|nr:class I SAM-dependent methyltransferase [Candidatus Margulisiibacteriota bacterium]
MNDTYRYVDSSYPHLEGTLPCAREIVPELIRVIDPKSVIDLGCGIGVWLSAFRERGVEDVVGVDGHWVDRERLKIPASCFRVADLSKLYDPGRRFDLAMSLETAEHLPSESAGILVDSLVRSAPAVFFSAAAPFVPGNLHINCQWPSYWAGLFSGRGYVFIDCTRGPFWSNPKVPWYYSQTSLIFVERSSLANYPLLESLYAHPNVSPLDIIHPEYYLETIAHYRATGAPSELGLRDVLSSLPGLAKKAVLRRLKLLRDARSRK